MTRQRWIDVMYGLSVVGMFIILALALTSNANAQKPPAPPGQGECAHGNSQKPCKEDPQPDRGKDCEEHGNKGGVNEDHCKGGTQPPVDPPVDPPKPPDPPKEPPTSNPPTTPETPVTPEPPASPESPPSSAPQTPDAPGAEDPPTFQEALEEDVKEQAQSNGATSAPSATSQTPATELPYTGFETWMAALIGAGLTGAGAWLRRRGA